MEITTFPSPALNEGELWAGILIGNGGAPNEHIILLPGEFKGDWKAANAWARKQGGELPTRRMQSLLFANLKEFRPESHWSSERHEFESSYIWLLDFISGQPAYWSKNSDFWARAIRRTVASGMSTPETPRSSASLHSQIRRLLRRTDNRLARLVGRNRDAVL